MEKNCISDFVCSEGVVDLSLGDDFSQRPVVSGIINRELWSLRNKVSSPAIRDLIDYYVVGGMTPDEQLKYLSEVGKDPLHMCRVNTLLDFSVTSVISLAPVISNVVARSVSGYEGDLGVYAALGLVASGAVINSSRLAYTFIKKKPIESFSIVSLGANSTTYLNMFSRFIKSNIQKFEFTLRANHPDMFYDSDSFKKSLYEPSPSSSDMGLINNN